MWGAVNQGKAQQLKTCCVALLSKTSSKVVRSNKITRSILILLFIYYYLLSSPINSIHLHLFPHNQSKLHTSSSCQSHTYIHPSSLQPNTAQRDLHRFIQSKTALMAPSLSGIASIAGLAFRVLQLIFAITVMGIAGYRKSTAWFDSATLQLFTQTRAAQLVALLAH